MRSLGSRRLVKIAHLGRSAQTLHTNWVADRFKKGHQASNPASTRALVQHRVLRFLETALLILSEIASVVAVATLKFIKRFSA
jgi:hypothetical protein